MKIETCMTCVEWDNDFCGSFQEVEGFCERNNEITVCDYFCKKHKVKLTIRIMRLYHKIKNLFKRRDI